MKKLLFVLFTIVLLITGCKKNTESSSTNNNNANPLIGLWSDTPYLDHINGIYYSFCDYVYDFINDNTLVQYVNANYNRVHGGVPGWDTPMPNHPNWYYAYTLTYTYTFQNNKVILTNGTILTYMNDKLYLEGSSQVLSRWDWDK